MELDEASSDSGDIIIDVQQQELESEENEEFLDAEKISETDVPTEIVVESENASQSGSDGVHLQDTVTARSQRIRRVPSWYLL